MLYLNLLLVSCVAACAHELYPHYHLHPYNVPFRDFRIEEYEHACTCALPPFPKHGRYQVLEPDFSKLSPGNQRSCFVLTFECAPGYHKTTDSTFTCYENGQTVGAIPKCLPVCQEKGDSVLSCGSGWFDHEAECISPRHHSNNVMDRWMNTDAVGNNRETQDKEDNKDKEDVKIKEDAKIKEDLKIEEVIKEKEDAKDKEGVKDKDGVDAGEPEISLADPRECGYYGLNLRNNIVGGRIAKAEELPWHAGIYTKRTAPYMQICGGSLVSDTVVISAAHCFWSEVEKQLPASNYAVAVGKLYRPWNDQHDMNAQKSDVAEIRIPPRFRGSQTNLQDDIALVIVSKPFRYSAAVRHVCLDFNAAEDKKILAGRQGKVAGWGLVSEDGAASPVLKVVDMPVVPIDKCIDDSDPTFKPFITSDKICAGYENGTAVCKGDSGGGLAFQEYNSKSIRRRYTLRGVVSAAPPNDHLCNVLAWATFTHVLDHEGFIRETIPEPAATPA